MKKYGQCALCGKETELEKSHIIPKFVFRRIINNSATGFMRNIFNSEKRIQDGSKQYLLCGDCEDRFNSYETIFASNVFNPYKNGKLEDFEYKEWLSKFIISVNWRTLYLDLLECKINKKVDPRIGLDGLKKFAQGEKILREFLLDKRNDIGKIDINMFIYYDVKSAPQEIIDCRPHSFFYGSAFDYTVTIPTECGQCIGIIANLAGIIIYTTLYSPKEYICKNTRVDLCGAKFKVSNQQSDHPILRDIVSYMIECRSKEEELSEKEKEKIMKKIDKNPEKLIKSESYKNAIKDEKLKSK